MKLLSLTLYNFRQFLGEQTITFTGKTGRNVVVVFGENGRGKTGIFRALMYCLFGEKKLEQDGNISNAEIQLINTTALYKSADKAVTMWVQLLFEHDGNRYTLQREMYGTYKNEQLREENGPVSLSCINEDGNIKKITEDKMRDFIESILDKRVRDYFLFDGEKIERITRAGREQQEQIKLGIRKLLDIDTLERGISILKKYKDDLEKKVREMASPEIQKIMLQLQREEDRQILLEQTIEEWRTEIDKASSEIQDLDRRFEAVKDIKPLLEQRLRMEKELAGLEKSKEETLTKMKTLVLGAATLSIENLLGEVFHEIDSHKSKGEIPSEIRKDFIEKLLAEEFCICGQTLCEGSDAYKKVREWFDKTTDTATQDAQLELWRYLAEIDGSKEAESQRRDTLLAHYADLRNKHIFTENTLTEIKEQLKSHNSEDVFSLEDQREKTRNKRAQLEVKKDNAQNEITKIKYSIEKLKEQLKDEQRKKGQKDVISKQALLVREAWEGLDGIAKDFSDEIKTIIAEKASCLLKILLDEEGKKNISTLKVEDNFSLQVLDRWGKPFLANISAGQRQILSIAFITSLAQTASNDTLYEMPLFMDTPFGRLSSIHRRSLIENIPQWASQWILLATDTEFRLEEGQWLLESGRWDKFFRLIPDEHGNTYIKEEEFASVLGNLQPRPELYEEKMS